jgi:hypothetical protein
VASEDGLSLAPYSGADAGQITINGEINKLASNIGLGRNFAGVHWRTDYSDGSKLGEAVALSILSDQKGVYGEDFEGFEITKFDGTNVTVSGKSSTRRHAASTGGAFGVEGAWRGGSRAAVLGAFVFVELAVGGFDEFGGGAAVFGVDADADADAHGRLTLIGLQAVLDALGDLLGHAFVRVNHDESKLIAAVAHGEVGGTAVFGHDRGETLEGAVSHEVAVEIVDAFETVEVE